MVPSGPSVLLMLRHTSFIFCLFNKRSISEWPRGCLTREMKASKPGRRFHHIISNKIDTVGGECSQECRAGISLIRLCTGQFNRHKHNQPCAIHMAHFIME